MQTLVRTFDQNTKNNLQEGAAAPSASSQQAQLEALQARQAQMRIENPDGEYAVLRGELISFSLVTVATEVLFESLSVVRSRK